MTYFGWIVAVVALTLLTAGWVAFTATRLDRLHVRVDATFAALDAALVRRAAALSRVVEVAGPDLEHDQAVALSTSAERARTAVGGWRAHAENQVGKSVNEVAELRSQLPARVDGPVHELSESGMRVLMARQFYNDAVRDTRALRTRRVARLLHLAGHRDLPDFFDIDDSTELALSAPVVPAPTPASKG